MKYHALFAIFEKAAIFLIVLCCKLQVALLGLMDGRIYGICNDGRKFQIRSTVLLYIHFVRI